ncbi:MAG: response regulator [Pseudomonadota bacterium]|nr:response regulator [Pseudomonadota bacterium]
MFLEPKSFEAAITAADFSTEDYCGTSYAAKLLGLSVATVQSLVEKGEIEAWKTLGGHRRIALQSIHAYLGKNSAQFSRADTHPRHRLRVLLVEDDECTRELYRCQFDAWELPIDCTSMASALEALMDISSMRPDLLITDLSMPGVDGIEMLRTIQRNHHLAGMQIIVISGLPAEAIAGRGGLPPQARLVHKPVNPDWLHGYITALADSQRQRAAGGRGRP